MVAQTESTEDQQLARVVPCMLNDQLMCFDSAAVESIAQGTVCQFFEHPMDAIVGDMLYKGREIPVFALRKLLELPDVEQVDRQYVVTVSTSQGPCGVLVDDVLGARNAIAALSIPAITLAPEKPFFSGIVELEQDARSPELEQSAQAALLISCDGLVGVPSPAAPEFLSKPRLDLGGISQEADRATGQLMLFDLPHQAWNNQVISIGLSVTQVLEVGSIEELLPVPCASAHTLGLFPWRDQFVPVVDLTAQLELETMPEEARRRIVIARSQDDELIGFYATTNIQTVRLPMESAPIDMDEVSKSPRVRGSFVTQTGVVVIPCIQELTKPEPQLVTAALIGD